MKRIIFPENEHEKNRIETLQYPSRIILKLINGKVMKEVMFPFFNRNLFHDLRLDFSSPNKMDLIYLKLFVGH